MFRVAWVTDKGKIVLTITTVHFMLPKWGTIFISRPAMYMCHTMHHCHDLLQGKSRSTEATEFSSTQQLDLTKEA